MTGNWWEPACGTGILPVAIGPETGWKPVPHQMPDMSRFIFERWHSITGQCCIGARSTSRSLSIGPAVAPIGVAV